MKHFLIVAIVAMQVFSCSKSQDFSLGLNYDTQEKITDFIIVMESENGAFQRALNILDATNRHRKSNLTADELVELVDLNGFANELKTLYTELANLGTNESDHIDMLAIALIESSKRKYWQKAGPCTDEYITEAEAAGAELLVCVTGTFGLDLARCAASYAVEKEKIETNFENCLRSTYPNAFGK